MSVLMLEIIEWNARIWKVKTSKLGFQQLYSVWVLCRVYVLQS